MEGQWLKLHILTLFSILFSLSMSLAFTVEQFEGSQIEDAIFLLKSLQKIFLYPLLDGGVILTHICILSE